MKMEKNIESNSNNKIINNYTPILIRKFSIWKYNMPTDFREIENFKIEILSCEVYGVKNFYKPISKY
jgi:hypothetical protein